MANESMGDAAKRKAASDCYRKGNEALEKGNWDYALDMFCTCASLVPDNVMYRQLARGTAYKKYDNNKSGAGALAKSKLIGLRGKIKKARASQDWNEVDRRAEEGLKINPWDAQLNADLGQASAEREFLDIAKFAYTCARNSEPDNKDLNWKLAELLEQRSEFTEAAKVWQHICKLDPNDGDARSRVNGALFKETTAHGGYENAENTRDVSVHIKNVLGNKGGPADAPGMSVEKDMQHAIRKEPEKVEHYLKLGHHYRQNKKLDEARETLQKALEISGGDPNVQEQIEDIELDQMRKNLQLAKERLAEHRDDESLKERVRELDLESAKRELQVYSKRIEALSEGHEPEARGRQIADAVPQVAAVDPIAAESEPAYPAEREGPVPARQVLLSRREDQARRRAVAACPPRTRERDRSPDIYRGPLPDGPHVRRAGRRPVRRVALRGGARRRL